MVIENGNASEVHLLLTLFSVLNRSLCEDCSDAEWQEAQKEED